MQLLVSSCVTLVKNIKTYMNKVNILIQLIKEAKEKFDDFAQTRMKGAEKIANSAKEKGGLSLLTYNHFKVKLPYYKKATEGKFDVETSKKEFQKIYNSISFNMTQMEFQMAVGKLEVLGELIIRNKK